MAFHKWPTIYGRSDNYTVTRADLRAFSKRLFMKQMGESIDKWDEVENVIGMTWVDNEYPQNAYPIGAGKCDEYTILR